MQATRSLAERFAASFPAEAAGRLETLASAEVAAFLSAIEPAVARGVIERMRPAAAARAFEALDGESLELILEHLPVDRAVLVLRCVDKARREAMVGLLPPGIAAGVVRLLRSPEGSAGALAEPVPSALSAEMSVEEARHAVEELSGPYAYVVDSDHRLLGVIHRKDLARVDARSRVSSLMSRQVVRLPSDALGSEIHNHPAWNDFDLLPVVDGNGVLVGVIRHRLVRSTVRSAQAAPMARQTALSALLDLGEVYWGGLTSALAAMARGSESDVHVEVADGT